MHHVLLTPTPSPTSLILASLHVLLSNPLFMVGVGIPLALILADVLTGVGAALKRKEFDMTHIADFLSHDLVKYMTASGMLVFSFLLLGATSPLTIAALSLPGLLAVSIAASIFQNVQLLFPKDEELTAFVGTELQKAVPTFQPAQYMQSQQQAQAQPQYQQMAQQNQYLRPQFAPQPSQPSYESVSPNMDPALINVVTTPMKAMTTYPQLQPTVNGVTGNQVLPQTFTPAAIQTPQGPQYMVTPQFMPPQAQ